MCPSMCFCLVALLPFIKEDRDYTDSCSAPQIHPMSARIKMEWNKRTCNPCLLLFKQRKAPRLEKSCLQLSGERSCCFSMCKINHTAKYSRFKNVLLFLLMEGVGCAFEDFVDPSVYCFCIMFWELSLCTPCDLRSLPEYSGESGFTAHIQVIKPGHSDED